MIETDDAVLAHLEDGILTLTLNRPDKGNAWNRAVGTAYFAHLEAAARSPDVRVIVVTGAGKAFCVGGDGEKLAEAAANDAAITASPDYALPLRVAKPVIAAVNGACFGIGLQQALCCDLRFASTEAKFSTAYARRGLSAEFGMSWLLPRLVGTGNAADMLLSARLLRAGEARAIGLVNRVVEPHELMPAVLDYAHELARLCSPWSMQAIKGQLRADLSEDFAGSYTRSETLLEQASGQADFREGVASWREGRAPQFPPLAEGLAFLD